MPPSVFLLFAVAAAVAWVLRALGRLALILWIVTRKGTPQEVVLGWRETSIRWPGERKDPPR